MKKLLYTFNLQLFAEGGAAGGDGAGGDGQGVTGAAAMPQTKGAKNPLADVQYGVQKEEEVPAAEVQETQPQAPINRDAEFEKLIKGDYKEQYDARVQDTIQKRLKSSKDIVDKYNSLTPTLELLAKKYGVTDPTDITALNQAIQNDNALYEDEALEQGMSVEKFKEFKQMQRENAALKATQEEQMKQEKGRQLYESWMRQAEDAKAVYPSFDLRTEMQNERFVDLLRSNIDVKTAYEVLHKDDIISGAMQYTAKTVESKIAKKIAANGARPSENGVGSQSAAVVKNDVTKLNRNDIDEVMRRVASGERITFG